MNPPDAMTTARPALIHVPVTEIFAIAAIAPDAEALRHKRRGQWRSWSWASVAAESERLARALRERGVDDHSIVAISGDYTPVLLLFAISAARAGARVASVQTSLTRAALADWLRNESVTLAFVGLREQLGTWQAALAEAARRTQIVVDFHLPWGHPAGAGITAASDFLDDVARGRELRSLSREVLWIEEGTDWTDGLGFILHALGHGATLAFPESRTAAGRDRRETQPVRFALSAAHRAALARGLATRLPTGRSLGAWLTHSALTAGRRGLARWHQRWLIGRLRRPFGLAHLSELTVARQPGTASEQGDPSDLFTALGIPAHDAPPGAVAGQPTQPRLAFA
jgi:acyl-CoA synthetase (AMP-forming)/AMP-acid ligase II